MYAVMGITGQVGGAVARRLLATGHGVRAIVRRADRGAAWAGRGCEIAVADMHDAGALREAFTGVDGVFVMLPPNFDPSRAFLEAHALVASIGAALDVARPPKVVCLSTIGAQVTRPNLLKQLRILEQSLGALPLPIAFVRAAWFMENAAWDVEPALATGVVPTFLQPLDRPFPMVAADDVGRVAAELLLETWTGRRVVELEGPRRVAPNEIAATRQGAGFLQHGAVMLGAAPDRLRRVFPTERDPLAGMTTIEAVLRRRPSFEETMTALAEGFRAVHGLELAPGGLAAEEMELAESLVREKYGTDRWTRSGRALTVTTPHPVRGTR